MLLAIVIKNLIWALPVCLLCGIIGFSFRSLRLGKLKKRISELESEMLQNHAEILMLQRDNAELINKLKNTTSVPVIPISGQSSGKENTAEGVPDVASRKKLLGSSSNKS